MVAVFWASMGFMTRQLVDFFQTGILPVIARG
jgi:hypothetical protein